MKARYGLAALAISTLITVAACGAITPTDVSPGAGRADQANATPAKKASASVQDGTAKIGDKVKQGDLTIEVTRTGSATASAYAAGAKKGDHLATFTVRITNSGSEKFDTALASVDVSYGNDGDSAEAVFDSGKAEAENTFAGTITKGKSRSADFAYAIPKKQMENVQIEVSPNFITEGTVIFQGALKS